MPGGLQQGLQLTARRRQREFNANRIILGERPLVNTTTEMLDVKVIVSMPAAALQAIVANAKALTQPDEKGHYHIDTADKVGEMISKFLAVKDFETYVADIDNYP